MSTSIALTGSLGASYVCLSDSADNEISFCFIFSYIGGKCPYENVLSVIPPCSMQMDLKTCFLITFQSKKRCIVVLFFTVLLTDFHIFFNRYDYSGYGQSTGKV